METKGTQQYRKYRLMLICYLSAATLTATMLFVLTGCISPLPPASTAPENRPLTSNNEAGIALSGNRDISVTRYLYSIDIVTNTQELTEQTIAALSTIYTDSVQLEFALVHQGAGKWTLFHTSESLPITITSWMEYITLRNQDNNNEIGRSTQSFWWEAYPTEDVKQVSLATGSTAPSTVTEWVDVINSNSGRGSLDIAKLLFSVKVGNVTKHVLYLSNQRPTGQPPDGGNICSGSRSGGFYCTFIRWWNG